MATTNYHQYFKTRITVFSIMLILGCIGLLIMDVHSKALLLYSQIIAVCYSLLSISLYAYVGKKTDTDITTIWHQLIHWLWLIIMVYLTLFLVSTGIMSASQAGFMNISLLSLSVFINGVYSDPIFMLLGIMLTVFVASASMIQAYLSFIMIPLIIIVAVIIYFTVSIQYKRSL